MGIISRMERARVENPSVPLSATNVLASIGFGDTTPSGVTVNQTKALGITAFWAGVRIISQTIAGLPCEPYERTEKGRRLATEHPAYKLLHIRPNPFMTPFTFKEIRAAHCLTWGNSYAEIEYDKGGRPIALWPLLPDRTEPVIKNGEKIYSTVINGVKIYLSADRVLHVPGLGFDGIKGYNVIKMHRDSLGLTIAANEYGAQFFGNSGRPSGVIKHPGNPEPDERQQLREEWNQMHTGLNKAQRTAVLWGNMDWKPITIPPEEAQFLTTRQMQIEEVARILNINPILLQQTSKQTSWGSGVEKFLVAFGKFTIMPWLERDEDAFNWDLFRDNERGKFYVKYNINQLLRGDAKMQAEILEIKRRNGVINADEWRELEEQNPLPDGLGKEYILPLNMMPISQIMQQDKESPPQETPPQRTRETRSVTVRNRLREAHIKSFEDAARRYVKRDSEALIKAVKRAVESGADTSVALNRWIEEFYPAQEEYIIKTMLPQVTVLATVIAAEASDEVGAEAASIDTFAQSYTENLAKREAGSSIGQVRALIKEQPEEGLQEALTTRAAEWEEKRPGKVAMNEVVRVATGAARFAWTAAGVKYLVWRANPGACPLCQEMDGKRVGIQEYFLAPNESVTPSERPGGLVNEYNLAGPPLHESCSCTIVPE
ncbi:MAG: phage portal protein [Dehalococcoidales bacterium]|nr:phage portal protein [Dehalococcoidales bacterium]